MSRILALFSRFLGVIILLILVLLLAIWVFSPLLVSTYAPKYLSPLKLELTANSEIRLNPFSGAIHISELGLRPTNSSEASQNVLANGNIDTTASVSNGVIDLSLLALLEKRLSFDQLDFEQLHLNIKRDDDILSIAGYILELDNAGEQDASLSTPPSPTALETSSTSMNAGAANKEIGNNSPSESNVDIRLWTLEIPSLAIRDFQTNIQDYKQTHSVHLEDFSIDHLELSHDWLAGKVALSALLNSAPFNLSAEIDFEGQTGTVAFNAELEKLPSSQLAYLAKKQLDKLNGALSFDINGAVSLQEKGTTITLNESFVDASNLDLALSDIEVRESSLRLDVQSLKLVMPSEGELSATGAFAIDGQAIELGPSNSKDVLVSIEQISLPEQTFSFIGPATLESSIKIIDAEDIQYSLKSIPSAIHTPEPNGTDTPTTTAKTLPALAVIDKLVIEQISASTTALSIESIELGKLSANALIDAQQQLSNLVSLSESPENAPRAINDSDHNANVPEEQTVVDEEKPAYRFSLGSFLVAEPGTINLNYKGVEPPLKQSIRLEKASLEKLDSSAPLSYSQVELAFSANDYTRADISGEIAPFADQTNLNLDIQIKEFMLPSISPFIRSTVGFDMSNGQLDSDTQLAIVNDEISGNAKLEIRGLEVDNAGDVHTGSLAEKTFIPLNIALGALKDSDGRIELEIGLTGNVHGPNFGLNGFLNLIAQKAALAASKSYLINTFVPYANIVTLTQIAGSYALTPRVDDLVFEPGQYKLTEKQTGFLDKLAALLEDKKDTDMKACGFSTYAEEEATKDTITAEKTNLLRELAFQRESALKTYLVSEKNILSSRILLCGGKIDQRPDEAPRIEFKF